MSSCISYFMERYVFCFLIDVALAKLLKAINFEGRLVVLPRVADQPINVTISFSLEAVNYLVRNVLQLISISLLKTDILFRNALASNIPFISA